MDNEKELEKMPGAFVGSLTRNNKQIRSDRAIAIAEDAQMIFKRNIEDMDQKMRRLKRDRENALDLSPADSHSLKLASDFNAQEWADKDIAIGVELFNLERKLQLARERYAFLFENKEEA